ncbi:MAG: YbbR-like domain-containing protein [Chloroflexota bacterium]
MIGWFSKNWRTMLWALTLAVTVWIAAVTADDPDEERVYPDPVPVEIVGQDPGLVINGDYPREVEVTLRAPRSIWDELRAEEAPVRAILDLSGLSAGEHTVNIQIQVALEPARIVSASPGALTLLLEPLATRTIPVDVTLNGQPAVGYEAGQVELTPQEVVLSGAESVMARVERVRVVVNMSGTRESVNQLLAVQVLDEANQPVSGLSVNPSSVQVNLPIAQQGGYRDVAVKVVARGQVASGYLLTKLSVFPPVVTVFSSDPSLVNALPGVVETQPLDLQNASDDIFTRLALNLPEGVSVVGEQSVEVEVGIDPIQSNLTLPRVTVEFTGLEEGLSAAISPTTVDVILSGPSAVLNSLSRQDVRVVVDLTGLAEGTHQLTPKIEILVADVSVESILPATVEVVITPGVTPTSTP